MIYKTLYRELCDEGGESVMRCIGLEMKKNLHWPYVLLSVAGIACLGFCGTVFDPSGTQTGYYLFCVCQKYREHGNQRFRILCCLLKGNFLHHLAGRMFICIARWCFGLGRLSKKERLKVQTCDFKAVVNQ